MLYNVLADAFFDFIASKPGTLVVSIVSMFAGGWITHKFEVAMAKRTEYNELADRLFSLVDRTVSAPEGHTYSIPEHELKQIRRRMSRRQCIGFDKAIEEYKLASSNTYQDGSGQAHFRDPDSVNASLRKIALLLNRK